MPASKVRVFIDADVLIAGAATKSDHAASLLLLRLAELTLIEAVCSEQVIVEAARNLEHKIPAALPAFQMLVSRCLRVVDDPVRDELEMYQGAADSKDLPILIAAHREHCRWLTTFNIKHFQPGVEGVIVLRPGELILQIRELLTQM
jgi:predicted nucleic acid-binding protein